MAANQVAKKRKSNSFKNCPKKILKVVPQNFCKLTFSDLVPGVDYINKVIIGKINHLYPLGQRANGAQRKILITDALDESENDQRKLAVFLFDQYALDSVSSEVDGYIILANFIVEPVPSKNTDLPVQVLVKRNESQVWFATKCPKQTKKKSDESNFPKKQKMTEEDEEPNATSTHHYEYTKLGDLLGSDESYNVYGVVDKCDLKVVQGRKLQVLELLLTDQTEAGFSCSVFAGEGETFPDIYPGDIVRIHRMKVYKFRNKLKGRCPNPKYILVFSKHNDCEKPRTVAKTFTFVPEDTVRARELLEWNKMKNDPKLVSEIEKDDFVNIICQVIGVYVAKTEAVILKIWDGTKTNEFPGVHLGFKEEKLDQRLFTIARDYYVNLFVYGHHIASASELEPGKYIEVRDAHLYSSKYNPEEHKLTLHAGNKEGRGIFVLEETDERVLQLKERLEKIISDTLEFGNQTEDLLSQNNSIFLNCDISLFNSQKSTNGHAAPESTSEGQVTDNVKEFEEQRTSDDAPYVNADVNVLNEPLSSANVSHEKNIVSVVDVSIKPGQSTQEFGPISRDEPDILDDENRISVTSEPDPLCNLTPLQTRYFFHDPQRAPSQMTNSIFPKYTNETEDEWWNSIPTVSEKIPLYPIHPVTDQHSDIKPNTLAEIVRNSVPCKFRVLAAVFCFKPNTNSIQKFIHLSCPKCPYISEDACPLLEPFETKDGLSCYYCPICKEKEASQDSWPTLEYTFLVSFSLHDGSGPPSVEAYLWRENAVKFFKGITPEDALRDSATADSILHMLWNICPNCRPFNSSNMENSSGYPVLDCCILSYCALNETQYQIFDTILV